MFRLKHLKRRFYSFKNSIRLINTIIIVFSGIQGLSGQYISHPPEPWREEYEISLKGFEFSHPMTVLSADELAIIRQRILYDVDPQRTAFEKLMEEADAALEFTPYAPQTLEIPGGYVDPAGLEYARNVLWDNCHAAYSCALVYAITGDKLYAGKAVEVLMHWADRGIRFYGDDSGLQLGSWFSPMLYAADLLHNYTGWETTDQGIFKTWWRSNCLEDGDVLGVLRRKDNNWKDAALLGTFAASVVLEDTVLLKEAIIQLKSYFYSRTDANVQLPGKEWKIAVDQHGVYLPREVVRNDGRSGLTYTAYALTTMVQGMEIARYAGFDYWQDTTELGATIGDVIGQYYAWDVLNESFPWNRTPTKSDKRRNAYELANLYYNFSPGYKDFLENIRPVTGREGDEYCTLNKGDMTGTDTIPVAAPSSLSAKTLSSTKTELTWIDNSNNEYGFKIERSSGQEFILIDSCGSGNGFYRDTGLLAGTGYTYRVFGFNSSGEINYSNESAVTTQAFPDNPPDIPAVFSARTISSSQIELSWKNNSDNEEGYVLERKEEEVFIEIARPGVNDTVFNDSGLEAGTPYIYRIRAHNLAGYSGYTGEAIATTLANGGKFQEAEGIVSMEAEYGEPGSLWIIGKDESASGGKYLEINPTRNQTNEQPECELPICLATYFFTIHEDGDYNFWFRTMSEGDENDSFFWRLGTAPWTMENGRSGMGSWHYSENDQLYGLVAGDYILEITYSENGTRLDKFVFQLDSLTPPEGKGPVQSIGIYPLPPKKPAFLNAAPLSDSEIELTWTDYANNEDGYIVERKENDSFVEVAQLGPGADNYADTGLAETTSYIYRVYAFNSSGNSNYSNTDTVTTLPVTAIPVREAHNDELFYYPNPFSEKITIRFMLKKPGEVSLNIYDTNGHQVVHQERRFMNSGWHSMEWKGTSNNGIKIPAGIYFCRIQFDQNIQMIKLILND